MLESGHTIADYQIVTPLDENQLFTSYQVTGPSIEVAKLLLLDVEQLVDKKSRQTFIAQAQLLCGQSFPGLCSLIAADCNDEHSYCLYPVPAGAPLSDWLNRGFRVRESLELVRSLAAHLGPAHASGLWHGAISPATIYLDDQGVSLDQFALASLLRLDFNSGIDPCYSSPELVRGEPLCAASDLYSLGILLYRLLVGKVPFAEDEPFATAMLHVQEQAAPLPESLKLLQPLLDNLINPVASERWTADQLVNEIGQLLMLPELDSLSMPEETVPENEVSSPLEAEEDSDPTPIEQVLDQSEMAARIEQRLQERADALQQSANLTPDNKRASTARISAIGRQSYRKSQTMNQNQYRKSGSSSRLFLLVALGIAVGVAIYLFLFPQQKLTQQLSPSGPDTALLAGLEQGSRQLEQGALADAKQTFSKLSSRYPMSPQPYNNLAAIAAQKGDLELARELLERALATDLAYATVYRNLGTVYAEMARDSYGRALQLEKGQQAVTLQVFGGTQLVAVNTLGKDIETDTSTKVVATVVEPPPVAVAAQEVTENVQPVAEPPEIVVAEVIGESAGVAAELTQEQVDEPISIPDDEGAVDEPASFEQFLLRWAAAWSNQDVPAYLSFYAADFVPSSGISHEDWVAQRQDRLTRPDKIEVALFDFSLLRQADEKLQIEVTQDYQSDRYQDRTRKRFDLEQTDAGWQITRERSLGRVR